MKLYVKVLTVPVLALGLACSTSGSSRTKTARSGQGAGASGSASTTTGGSGASASGQAAAGVTSPSEVASDLKGHASDKLITGRIADVSQDHLSITSDQGGREELNVVAETVVQIDGRDAHATDLKPGQDVRASYNDLDGKRIAVKIEAPPSGSGASTSGTGSSTSGSDAGLTPPSEARPGQTGSSSDDSGRAGTTGASGPSNPNTEAPPGTPPSGQTGQTTTDPSKKY